MTGRSARNWNSGPRGVYLALTLALLLLGTAPARGADAALVVGIGVTSFPAQAGDGAEHPQWRMVEHREAREEAERAFRELVRAAAAGPLYSVGPLWYDDGPGQFNPAVLLTDGTTDNRAIPTAAALRTFSRRAFAGLGPADEGVVFLAGLGRDQGPDAHLVGRRGAPVALSELSALLFARRENGRRVLVARLYREEAGPVTLYAGDPASARALRAWSETACEEVQQ